MVAHYRALAPLVPSSSPHGYHVVRGHASIATPRSANSGVVSIGGDGKRLISGGDIMTRWIRAGICTPAWPGANSCHPAQRPANANRVRGATRIGGQDC